MDSNNTYIEINPNIRFGKPCIKGTRISVDDIKSMLASGMTTKEIISDFPQLSKEEIKACLEFQKE
jgi:uncharacterized protein (DUF433 family)